MQKRAQVLFSGQVQGVGFRFSAQALAADMGIAGWVKNLRKGDVELVVEGEEAVLKDFIGRLEARFKGYVRGIEVSWQEATGEFKKFEIKF